MIINDLQRLRWQILDECLRDTSIEYFMGGAKKEQETETIKCLYTYVNRKLRTYNREYKCSKRQLQLDVDLFEKKGGRLEPRFRRGHKRILRYINTAWKNPLLREAVSLTEGSGKTDALTLSNLSQIRGNEFLALRLKGAALTEVGQTNMMMSTTITDDTIKLFLSYGADIEVLSPMSLRDRLRQVAQALLDIYSRTAQEPVAEQPKVPVQQELFAEEETQPLSQEQPIIEEQPVVEQSVVEEQVEVVEQPEAEEQPEIEEQPVAEEQPVVEEEPIAEELPVVDDQPVVEEQPVAKDQPVVEEEPVAEERLVIEEQPVVKEEPVAEEQPEIEEQPEAEEQSVVEEQEEPKQQVEPVAEKVKEEKPAEKTLFDLDSFTTPREQPKTTEPVTRKTQKSTKKHEKKSSDGQMSLFDDLFA